MSVVRPYALGGSTVLTELTVSSGDIVFSAAGNLLEGTTPVFSFDTSGNVTKIGQDSPSTNEVLTWDGAKWVAAAAGGGGGGGDITSVIAGTGLSGGGTSGDVTLNVANLAVAQGGTGATLFADKSVIISQDSGTDTLSSAVMDSNGQLLIGGTSGPAVGTLTAGSNITITNADGAITIASTGGGGGSGDISAVTAGTGLSGGGDSGDVTLSVDTSVVNTLSDTQTITGTKTFPNIVNIGKFLRHAGDTDTRLVFFDAGDLIAFEAGGVEIFRISEGTQDEFIVNDFGGDVDFRVEGNNDPNLIFAEASTNRVSIGVSTDSPEALLEVTGDTATGVPLLQLNNLDVDQKLLDINASNTTGDVIDLTADALTTGAIAKIVSNSSSTSDRTLIDITNDNTAAVNTILLQMKNDAVAAKSSVVIESTAAEVNPLVELINSHNSSDKPAILRFNKLGHVADDMEIGKISFFGDNDADPPEPVEYAHFLARASDVSNNSEGGELRCAVMDNGVSTTIWSCGKEDGGDTFTFDMNPDKLDLDFVIRGDNLANLFRITASNDAVGIGNANVQPTALLEIASTTKGVLFPTMTTAQRDAIGSPANGLMIFNFSLSKLQIYAAGSWQSLH